MFQIFQKKQPVSAPKQQSMNEIIEEIHESFYTEVDKLLAEARISHSLDTEKSGLIEKCRRLEALGFTSAQEVNEAKNEIKRLDELKRLNDTKERLRKVIDYFSFKYPNYKFITEDSVKRICKKYGLVYASIEHYKGTVPDFNLKKIEEFSIKEEDECYFHLCREHNSMRGGWFTAHLEYESKNSHEKTLQRDREWEHENRGRTIRAESCGKCPMEIAAPLKDFNAVGEVENYKLIEVLDPIVLYPVLFGRTKHYLIVTAWGIEASDPLVVNEKMN